jgi:hypothetical protein
LAAVKRKKGEVVTLYCDSCRWSTELPLARTEESIVIECAHCRAPLYWHRCPSCELCYAGTSVPKCPSCDDDSLDDVSFD